MLRVAPVICLLLICLAALPAAAGPSAAVRIIEGPTPVPNGKCRGSHDLTMINDRVAFSFAIDTERPWGNPAGAILDGGLVADGEVGKDRLSFVDFLPDGWNPWPHVRHEIRIVEDGPERAVLRVTRDFRGNPLVTTWTLHAGASELHVETRLENKSGKPLKGLLSGYSFCTKDGNTFVVEEPTTAERPATGGADWLAAVPTRADWAAGYGPDWAGGLLFPGADRVAGGRSWKDLYRATDVEPGGEARLTAVYRLSSGAGISDLPVALARSNGRGVARLSGTVRTSAGDPVSDSYILFASPEGAVMGWAAGDTGQSSRSKSPGRTQGTFSFELPEGRWQVQALATDHRSPPAREVVVTSGQELTVDFDGLEPPGTVRLHVRMAGPDAATSGPDATGASVETGAHGPLSERGSVDASSEKATERLPAPPLVGVDARIVRVGTPPPVRHAERFVTYTSLQDRGEASFPCPPGEHEFLVSHGGGFLAPFERVRLVVEPGKTAVATVLIPRQESPRDRGWYCADLHHHSDHADGTTSPEQLVLSQSAAGLDYFYVSDHDFVGNHAAISSLAASRGLPFIPGIEVSPSFGHFNLFPLPVGADPGLNSADTTPAEIFAAARRLGALVQANHPMDGGNAYLRSDLQGTVPGGFSLDFDLIELNADDEFDSSDNEALEQAFRFWDAGRAFWLSAGSDTHDVHAVESDEASGRARTCVHVTQDEPGVVPSPRAFASALKAGRAVATFGPLVYPAYEPGAAVAPDPDGMLRLPVSIHAAWGIAEVRVRSSKGIVWSSVVADCPRRADLTPALVPEFLAWYLVEVVDCQGNPAFVNPIRPQP